MPYAVVYSVMHLDYDGMTAYFYVIGGYDSEINATSALREQINKSQKRHLNSHGTPLMHVSRYIHLNHRDWKSWPYSSYLDYANQRQPPEWLHANRVVELFYSRGKYLEFVADYEDGQRMRDAIKHELANEI